MDIRTPLNQCIALIVAGVMFLNPIVSTAAQLTVDAAANANTSINQAGNGVPIVNIATPNGSGLSSNTFRDYNVGSNGLILNNATGKTQSTQLGGIIVGNPNLRGQAAQVILNQVTGGNRSTLQGYTEVAGQAARVIVANPHGITCNGCGFINTPRATLTTGKPIMDGERLDRFQVDGGDIAIEGDALNATNLDQFDLITRSAKLNTELHAKQLNIVTGRNDVQADTLQATPRADDGSEKPLLAIDSSALGGMYANTIRLVGTEQGVGVKLAGNMAATTGDIRVDANGKVTLAQTSSAGDLKIAAQSAELTGKTYTAGSATVRVRDDVTVGQSLAAKGSISVQGARIDNQGIIEAGVEPDNSRNAQGDVSLKGQTLHNRGSVVANRNLEIDSSATLDNQGGSLKGRNTTLTAGLLDNRKGQVLADDTLKATGGTIDNREQGLLQGKGQAVVNITGNLDNRGGRVVGQGDLQVTAAQVDNRANGLIGSDKQAKLTTRALLDNQNGGKLKADRLDITTAGLLNSGGQMLGGDVLIVASADIDNRLGLISAKRLLDLKAVGLDNSGKGNLLSDGTLAVKVATLNNRDNGMLSSVGDLSLHGERLDNRGGLVLADRSLSVTGGDFDNRDKGVATTKGKAHIEVASLANSDAGHLQSDGRLELIADKVDNQRLGNITAKGDLEAHLGTLNQQGGRLTSLGSLLLTANTIDNQNGGGIGATNLVDIRAARVLNQQGEISSAGKVVLDASALLDNQAGKVIGDRGLTLTVQRLLNQNKGLLSGYDSLSLKGTELLNNGGRLSSHTHIELALDGQLDNSDAGLIVSDGTLTLNAGTLHNRQGGKVSAIAAMGLTSQGLLDNQGGILVTDAGLVLDAARLDNSQGGAISAAGHAQLRSGAIDNSAKGNIGAGSLLLVATQLDNSARGRISASGQIDATLTGLDQHDHGQLVSGTGIDLDLQHGQLVNRDGGLLRSPGSLLLRQIGAVDNRNGAEISSDRGFSLVADRLDNRGGRLISAQDLTLRIAGVLDNSLKGVLSASHDLDVEAASLDNFTGGTLASGKALKAVIDGQLDNHDQGILSAAATLTVTSAGVLNSERGLLSGNTGLTVTTGQLDNHQGGQLISQAGLTVTSDGLDNRGGALSSKQAMTLTTGDVRNGADALQRGGRIHSDAELTLVAGQVDSSEGGEISAKGDLLLRVSALIQRQGRLIGEQKLDLDLNGGDLTNQGGLISANGPLIIQRLGKLDNSAGEVTSQQSFSLLAKRIDNQKGRILSDGRLIVEAAQLDNSTKGLMSGVQGLQVTGSDLNNSGEGTLSSKDGDLTVTLTGALDNRDQGALVSKGRQQVTAASLDNRKGIVSSEQAITLSVGDRLDNSGGLISATGDLTLDQDSTVIDNQGGQINGQAISVAGKRLENAKGQLISRAALDLTLADALLNTDGARLVSGADLLLKAARVDNQGGKLISHGLLHVDSGTLDNSHGGNLASQQNLVLRLSSDLLNGNDGLLFSEHGKLDIHAVALDNQGGTLKSQGDIDVRLDKRLDNRGGRLESQAGNLELHAASLDNSGSGMLSAAKGLFKGVFSDLFDNAGGTTQAQSVDIAADAKVNNQGGYLSALSGDGKIVTADLDNRGGGLYAAGLLQVQGQQLFNQSGKIGAGRIDFGLSGALYNSLGQLESESELQLRASELDNRSGNLRALGKTGTSRLIVAGNLLNDNGVLATANQDLDLQIGGLSNSGGQLLHTGQGSFGLASDKVTQAGGVLHTDGLLSIAAASWTNSSVLQARRLELDIGRFVQTASGKLLAVESLKGRGGDWTNHGLLASDGSLQLDLTGNYDGNGRLSSLGALTLGANDIRLSSTASLAGGADTAVTARNLLSNDGRLTALGGLTVTAASLENRGTLGGAAAVKLAANSLSNQRGLVFSGNDMTLRVGSLSNYYGDIYSLGALDLAGNASARAVLLDNISGSVESAGNMTLAVDTLLNRKEFLSSTKKLVAGNVNVYSDDRCKGKGCELYFSATESWEDVIDRDSPTAFITTGSKLTFAGDAFRNHYSSVSAAGDIAINTAVFENKGAGGGEQRNLTASMYTRDRGQYNAFIQAKNQFNQNPGSLTLDQVMAAAGYPQYSIYNVIDNRTPIAGAVVAPAVVQSAGAVTINATQRIDNSVVRVNQAGAGTIGARGDATADPRQVQTQVRALNPQLPPDLAQRQVNPVTLPSFSLPQGSNGLFRISTQTGQAAISGDALGATADHTQAGSGTFISPLASTTNADNRAAQTLSAQGSAAAQGAVSGAGVALDGLAAGVRLVQGVPERSVPSTSHKYLVETNPALTDLKQFLSSDYLLGQLNVNPDQAIKRLGDGLYEQRLIREAVVARTGQRYIDGMTSDETLFRYLMDNAIASKDKLSLSVGVSLSAEQVAALTHDIVWMEQVEVNGEKVLAPVLYLAHANGRVAPNGALIQGRDVNLISGGDLVNVGTLRATNNLAASATNISNSGLIEAGGRLDMLATDSIRNAQGGIIAGREVSLTALTGDVINERSVTRLEGRAGGEHVTKDLVDSAARIEAANDLTITAGRDIGNVGGVLKAGGDIRLDAGRDLSIVSQEGVDSHEYQRRRVSGHDTSITQYGSEISAGGNLTATAGQDLSIVASEVEARRDLALQAGRDVTLAAAANEEHSYAKGKKGKTKYERQEDDVEQQSAVVKAGGDLAIDAGRDLRLVASKVSAGEEAYLVAGDKLELLAANDSQYSLYDMSKKGGWGSKQTQRDEVTDVKAVGSEVSSGGDLTLKSGGDQLYQGAKLASGNDLTIDSGGAVTFEAVKDLHQESHEKSKSNVGWFSMKGEGRTDETVRQSELVAKGDLVINAVGKIHVDVRQVNQQTVSESIDAMVKADPKLAWLKQVEAQGGVDWRQVKEIHDSFKYSNSGLGPAAQLAIAIVMAAVVGPAAAAWANGGVAGAAVGAVATGAATNASVSVVNNRGDLGAVVKDVTSSDAMKGYVISGVAAGLTAAYFDGWTGTKTDPVTGKVLGPELYTVKGVGQFAANQTLQNGTSLLLSKALGQGGSASDALKSALFNTLAAASFNAVGDYTKQFGIENGSLPKIAIHAMVGGLLSKATGGDFKTGALAAGANEALVVQLNKLVGGNENLLTMSSQIVGVLAAASQEDADASSLNKAAWVAKNGTQYNILGDHSAKQRDEARDNYRKDGGMDAARDLVNLEGADQRSDKLLQLYKRDPSLLSQDDKVELAAYLQVYAFERLDAVRKLDAQNGLGISHSLATVQASVASLLSGEQTLGYGYPYAGSSQDKLAWADAQRSQMGLVENLAWTRDRSVDEQTYLDAKSSLRIGEQQQGLANLGDPAIYFLTGSIGSTIRAVAATNGALQFTQGAKQAVDGDGWNAAGNMVAGLLGMATLGIPAIKGGAGPVVVADSKVAGGGKGQGSEAPYNPQTTRNELEATYGRDNVLSTTVPPVDGRNVHLAGQRHPVTGVVFDNRGFPIFDDVTAFDTRISIDAFKSASYEGQMKLATKDLLGAIQQGQVKASSFTAKQLQQISAGAKKIDGYTWHHHQDSGRMQLVPELIHKKTGHIGGEAMGGGM
ncbi:filamentous hemagglutinin N-terminal domain-containing protein [Pseudomonas putida]|uniref:two-partner secretion domain-containing protein n=2 Tax=Pseudomonas TaxID=286 RepID=UPI00125EE3C2|nr:DUF637 domain-containing protein [Pseudomonas putida]KAB5627132.1 filamentous hemagglutinin N-terminal domain-containing protein [Pseudomonas putida]